MNFNWDGLSTVTQAFNPATDTLTVGTPGSPLDEFDVERLYTNSAGTGVILQLTNGFSYTMLGPVIEQLTDANIIWTFGDFDIGDNGNDFLTGTLVVGLGGNDDIEGQSGTSGFLQGNQGDDDIDGNGDNDADATNMDRIRGGKGNDDIYDFGTGSIVYGDQGDDDIYAENDADGVTIFGGNGNPNDPLDGGDYIEGSDGDDTIQGNGGDDLI
jgi:Ca2+-binding RTX toxin-like protein